MRLIKIGGRRILPAVTGTEPGRCQATTKTGAHTPATGEVRVSIRDRGRGPTRTLEFPNWPGTTDDVTVQLNDYDQP